MKKILLNCIFLFFLLSIVSCDSNPFLGKKYVAELMGIEVIGLDFINKSKVEIYFVGTENQTSEYFFDKKNNIVKILKFEIELAYNPTTYTLKWQSDGTEFVFYLTEEINISNDTELSFFNSQMPILPTDEYTSTKNEVFSWSEEYSVMSKTKDNTHTYLSVVFAYKMNDKVTSAELIERKVVIEALLKKILSQKTQDDLTPAKEKDLKIEIKNSINDEILQNGKIRDVSIQDLYFK